MNIKIKREKAKLQLFAEVDKFSFDFFGICDEALELFASQEQQGTVAGGGDCEDGRARPAVRMARVEAVEFSVERRW